MNLNLLRRFPFHRVGLDDIQKGRNTFIFHKSVKILSVLKNYRENDDNNKNNNNNKKKLTDPSIDALLQKFNNKIFTSVFPEKSPSSDVWHNFWKRS